MKQDIINGDSLEILRTLPDESIDSIVTDPPYGLKFMGKDWDHTVPGERFWREALRVAKPGAHLLAFGGTRTYHRLVCAIEDAGWEIRTAIAWLYGSGFPKSRDVSKAIDEEAGAEREKIQPGNQPGYQRSIGNTRPWMNDPNHVIDGPNPITNSAKQWSGWGTALKPAFEPICVARKPLAGTVARNVQEYGTGAINIDGCRIETADGYTDNSVTQGINTARTSYAPAGVRKTFEPSVHGRWPANVVHDGSEEVVRLFPECNGKTGMSQHGSGTNSVYGTFSRTEKSFVQDGISDSGSAARFFYTAKASSSERNSHAQNRHPTVKPVSLMRWLCRLVTPPNGVILDLFMGSGSTGVAAKQEGFSFIGIELDPHWCEVAKRRIHHAAFQKKLL
jgi:DNA modification methylase